MSKTMSGYDALKVKESVKFYLQRSKRKCEFQVHLNPQLINNVNSDWPEMKKTKNRLY